MSETPTEPEVVEDNTPQDVAEPVVPDDVEDDWMPEGYTIPEYDDPGDFPEPNHQMTEETS